MSLAALSTPSGQPSVGEARRARRARTVLMTLLLAAALLTASVQVRCADLLTSDGQCYLRMAEWYARGDFRHAVFGHWSPLGAWLAVPPVAAGVPARGAFRLLIGLWAVLTVWGAWRLGARLALGPWTRAAATASVALLAAQCSAEHRVDLLLTALLLLYLDAAMDERLLASGRQAYRAGVLGGLTHQFLALALAGGQEDPQRVRVFLAVDYGLQRSAEGLAALAGDTADLETAGIQHPGALVVGQGDDGGHGLDGLGKGWAT